ncbi:MAG: alpha/beta fold hydrolase [Candidatus Levybacteria bacterium]|nr:alpha/beta fold hydrolase [Candidatus Levybacteria bacterium]
MKSESVIIKSDGHNLSGTIIKPDGNEKIPAVVFYHGMISQSKPRYIKRAEELAKVGISSLCFDFRGCGESEGKLGELTLKDWLDDSILAFDYLINQEFVDKDRIGIMGKSFGGEMAALVAEKRNVRSIVLHAPAVYPDTWFDDKFTWDEEISRKRKEYRNSEKALDNNAIRAIEKFKGSLLVVGSELDGTCPKTIVKGYYEQAGSTDKKIEWIKGADHPLKDEFHNHQLTKLMLDWFSKTL